MRPFIFYSLLLLPFTLMSAFAQVSSLIQHFTPFHHSLPFRITPLLPPLQLHLMWRSPPHSPSVSPSVQIARPLPLLLPSPSPSPLQMPLRPVAMQQVVPPHSLPLLGLYRLLLQMLMAEETKMGALQVQDSLDRVEFMGRQTVMCREWHRCSGTP
jgi:hypothetical protein